VSDGALNHQANYTITPKTLQSTWSLWSLWCLLAQSQSY